MFSVFLLNFSETENKFIKSKTLLPDTDFISVCVKSYYLEVVLQYLIWLLKTDSILVFGTFHTEFVKLVGNSLAWKIANFARSSI